MKKKNAAPGESRIPSVLATDGRILGERDLRRGMRTIILAWSLGIMWMAMVGGMPFIMFMEALGASGMLIGLAFTVQQFAMLVQVPAALMSEMLTLRKPFWAITAMFHRVLWLIPPILPLVFPAKSQAITILLVVVIAVSSIFANMSAPVWWSWISELVPASERSRFWGLRQSITMAFFLFATVLSGLALDYFPPADPAVPGSFLGFALVLGIAGVFGCADIVVHMFVPEPRSRPVPPGQPFVKRILAPLKDRDFRALTLSLGVWCFSVGISGQFGMLYLKREFGVTYTQMTFLTVSGSLGVIAAGFVWVYVMDRVGMRNFGVVMMSIAPLCSIPWFFMTHTAFSIQLPFLPGFSVPQPIAILLIVNFVAGALFSGVGLVQAGLLSSLSAPDGRTMSMAVHWGIVGLAAAIGPFVGGVIMDLVPAHTALRIPGGGSFGFIHAQILVFFLFVWALAVPLFLRVRCRSGELSLSDAVPRMFILNPIRLVNAIINIYAMNAPDTSEERVSAVRRLGDNRTALAVADLIERLNDPYLEVREEAARSLGRIASQDGVKALISKLEDKTACTRLEAARGLRLAAFNRSLEPEVRSLIRDALLRRLDDKETDVVCECMRALGAIGDLNEAAGIKRLLSQDKHPKIVGCAAETLAKLGIFSAVYDILFRLKTVDNPGAHLTLIVALGDLLGKPEAFYGILARERRRRGAQTETILRDLSEEVKNAATCRKNLNVDAGGIATDVTKLDMAYLEGRFSDAVPLMLDIGRGLACLQYGLGPEDSTEAMIENIMRNDERFGVGLRFLSLLLESQNDSSPWNPSETEVLLGIWFLKTWADKQG